MQKYPSTIPASIVLDQAHNIQWIKDEIERRLWLGDRWLAYQEGGGNVTLNEALIEIVKSLNVFLDYREKYYEIRAAAEKDILGGFLATNSATEIENKLQTYKEWWTANKNNPINL